MISGGIVFRLVTPDHPGEASLDNGSNSIRTEFYCYGDPPWTTDREAAYLFPTYEAARKEAEAIGPRCHAKIATPPEEELPERLRHTPEAPPPPAFPKKKRRASGRQTPAVRRPEDWVTRTYG